MTERNIEPTNERKRRIPDFSSREEEAEFWDTHDFSEFWDELQPVPPRYARQPAETITLRFDAETLEKLRVCAQEQGIGPTILLRRWVLERLHQEEHRQAS